MILGFWVCFLIRPDMLVVSTAFSDFGNDVRTAPYFAGSVFFAAYGMWRWRNYLSRTWKRSMPVVGLVTLTVIGLYLIALMPISWEPLPARVHRFGVSLAGISMLTTVLLDSLLTKTPKSKLRNGWRALRMFALGMIMIGGYLTYASLESVGWYNVALLGETLLLGGYLVWIALKTYLGEGGRTNLSSQLKNIVLID